MQKLVHFQRCIGGGGYAVYHAWTYHFINIDGGSEHFAHMISFTHIVYKFYFFSLYLFPKGGKGGGRVGRTQEEGGGQKHDAN